MKSFHAAVTTDLPFEKLPEGTYDAATQVFLPDGVTAAAFGTGGSTTSWDQTNGGTDCSPLYTDDSRPWWR